MGDLRLGSPTGAQRLRLVQRLQRGYGNAYVARLVQRAVLNVFNRTFSLVEFDSLLAAFQRGATMHVSPTLSSQEYVKQALQIPGMKGAVAKLGATGNPAAIAAAVEFVLEGLHLNRKLNKERGETRSTFRA